ncbi:MAG TPA: phage tail tape measure protein, partial [Gemmatimonadales bacterium]|nr:phage tail tape measure protein [Gemmatimonadales bacterium]
MAAVGFKGLGRSIAFASGAFVGGAGLTAALKASIEGFTKFEDQMQKTVGLANVAEGSVGKFSKQVLALAPQVGRGPQELAKAFFFVASSGIAANKAMAVVKASAQGAVAGLGDTATVADALTSVINAYGAANINAAQAADVLTATVREGKGEADRFAPVIGNVVALAAQLGVSFDQVGAALAVQTRLGTDAETTAIQLQRVFSTLLKVTPKSAEAFESVGLNADKLREQLGEKNGLIKVLTQVKAAFEGNSPALSQAFGDVRALRGILNLVGKQTKSTQEVFDKLANSAGSAKTAFDAVDKDTAQQFRKLKASAEVLGISVGAIFAPLAAGAATALAKVTQDFT